MRLTDLLKEDVKLNEGLKSVNEAYTVMKTSLDESVEKISWLTNQLTILGKIPQEKLPINELDTATGEQAKSLRGNIDLYVKNLTIIQKSLLEFQKSFGTIPAPKV